MMQVNTAQQGSAFSRIGMYARSETRLLMIAVARELKQRHGSDIVMYTTNAQESAFYAQHGGDIFSEIVEAKTVHESAAERALPESEEVARAAAYEARLGVTYNFLSVSNRHLGRGYALGGFHHPRSRASEQSTYVNLLHAYNSVLEFWDREIERGRFTLILNGSNEFALMGRHHGVPYRVIALSRYRNYQNWAWDEFFQNPEFETAYKAGEGQASDDMDRPYHSHLVNRTLFIKEASLLRTGWRMGLEVARYAWWNLRGYKKARGYYLSQNLAMIYRIWSEWRLLNRLATVTLNDLKDQRFVYYPLHQEPEMALQGLSPEYFYQLSSIAAIARDLPAGVRLAVKETFGAVGRRPRDFYEQIAEFKNVIWLEPLQLGLDCVAQAEVIVTISGTAGFEAAVLGKPVVTFGQHNMYNFLPHVRVVTNEGQLVQHLRSYLGGGFDKDAARAAGLRFLRAVVSRSFDLKGYDFINVGNFEKAAVEQATAALVRSVSAATVEPPQHGNVAQLATS